MTQQEKENACIEICKYAILRVYNDTYEPERKNILYKINRLIKDIEKYLHKPYNGDRSSIVEVCKYILSNAWDLQQSIRKHEMDMYNIEDYSDVDLY